MYPFNQLAPLPTLHASGDGDTLIFKTPTEQAFVILDALGRIDHVQHHDLTNGQTQRINAIDAHHIVVGADNCERDVYHFLLPSPHPHLQLRLGLTVHRGSGTWSSLPHDFENHLENDFEEVFFYLLAEATQKAIQVGRGIWSDGSTVDAIWPVQDREFSAIPMGFHPVVGEPGVKVSYVWAYLAKKKSWEKISHD
jgi:5-deoxy-D-glucuronate isomerase